MDEFKNLVKEKRPHIIGITESWEKQDKGDAMFQLEGYNMYRNDREEKNTNVEGELCFM